MMVISCRFNSDDRLKNTRRSINRFHAIQLEAINLRMNITQGWHHSKLTKSQQLYTYLLYYYLVAVSEQMVKKMVSNTREIPLHSNESVFVWKSEGLWKRIPPIPSDVLCGRASVPLVKCSQTIRGYPRTMENMQMPSFLHSEHVIGRLKGMLFPSCRRIKPKGSDYWGEWCTAIPLSWCCWNWRKRVSLVFQATHHAEQRTLKRSAQQHADFHKFATYRSRGNCAVRVRCNFCEWRVRRTTHTERVQYRDLRVRTGTYHLRSRAVYTHDGSFTYVRLLQHTYV